MIRILFLGITLTATLTANSQTRIYFSLGSNQVTNFYTKPVFKLGLQNNSIVTSGEITNSKFGIYNRVELNVEKRAFGSIYFVSGLSWFNTGYEYGGDFFNSHLKNSYLSLRRHSEKETYGWIFLIPRSRWVVG